jgi:myo-inositol-1(or 4)-monophosphatase
MNMKNQLLTQAQMNELLGCAILAAQAGGRVIREGIRRRSELVVEHKRLNDLVSEIDRRSEEEIVRTILGVFPTHHIVAEEGSCNHLSGDGEFCWIIDPLDGTTNFLHGFQHFAVSIAVQYQGCTVAAVIYDPVRDQLFRALLGHGAFLNDEPIRTAKRSGMEQALISTGLPYPTASDSLLYFGILHQVWKGCRNVRRPGAAALDLAYLAAGFLDGFFEFALLPWDIAAGALLVTEAGGQITDLHGNGDYLMHGYIAAGSTEVHRDLLTAVRTSGAEQAWYRVTTDTVAR